MRYLKKFETTSDQNAWCESDYIFPNVVLTEDIVRYNIEKQDMAMYIEATEDITISFSTSFNRSYTYSKDYVVWSNGNSSTLINANAGERVFFRAVCTTDGSSGIGKFSISNGKCNVGGNVMSIVYGADFEGQTTLKETYQFSLLFFNCTNIVDASKLLLPTTNLIKGCYRDMFNGCTSLVNAPALPATTLAEDCYNSMFRGCTSLVNAPSLPATTLANSCYYYMFNGCTSLTTAPELPATTLSNSCYGFMFSGCISLVNAPSILPAMTFRNYCYREMFSGCTSLTTAPELPATTLTDYCYNYMFYGCKKLNYIKAMFMTISNSQDTYYWVNGVSPTGTFVKNSAATWDLVGNNGVPYGWTVEYADA